MGASSSQEGVGASSTPVGLKVEHTVIDGVTHTVIDGPATTAGTGSSKGAVNPMVMRLRVLRHPNIVGYTKLSDCNTKVTRKGSVVGLPQCRDLPHLLGMGTDGGAPSSASSSLTPSEALYGLKGIAEAVAMCATGNVYFSSLHPTQIGVSVAGGGCHAINANRWLLLDMSTANGACLADSCRAVIGLARVVFGCFDSLTLEAYATQRWGISGDAIAAIISDGANPLEDLLKEYDEEVEVADEGGAVEVPAEACGEDSTADADQPPAVPGCPNPAGTRRTVTRHVSTAGTFFASLAAYVDGLSDPLVTAMGVGHDLPTYYGADSVAYASTTSAGEVYEGGHSVSDALNAAYEQLRRVVGELAYPPRVGGGAEVAGSSTQPSAPLFAAAVELHRNVFPWLVTAEHLAQPVSSQLFADLFTRYAADASPPVAASKDPVGANGAPSTNPFAALVRECMAATDPHLNMRLFAHSAHWVRWVGTDDLYVLGEGVAYACYYTRSVLAGEVVTCAQLRYCRAVVRAAEHIVGEVARRCRSDEAARRMLVPLLAGVVTELAALLGACIEVAEAMASDYLADVYKLMRDTLMALVAMVPITAGGDVDGDDAAEGSMAASASDSTSSALGSAARQSQLAAAADTCRQAILMTLFNWSVLTRDQAINVVVAAIGTTMPLGDCGFLVSALTTLCGCEETSIRTAACTGLLRLTAAMAEATTMVNERAAAMCVATAAAYRAGEASSMLGPFATTPLAEGALTQSFVPAEQKRLAMLGYSEGAAVVGALGRDRLKATQQQSSGGQSAAPMSCTINGPFNAIFRTAADRTTFTAVLPHSAF